MMLICLLVFLASILMRDKADYEEESDKSISLWLSLVLVIVGLFAVIYGSSLFISGATDIAKNFGLSETVIGITIIAIGTSLPELVTGVIAAIKKQTDFAIGNILGSNIYNVFGVLGISSLFANLEISNYFEHNFIIDRLSINLNFSGIIYDAYFILVLTIIFVLLMRVRRKIGFKTGIIFLLIYSAYIEYLV